MLAPEVGIAISGWAAACGIAIAWYTLWFRNLNHGALPRTQTSEHAKQTFYQFKAKHLQTTLSACPDAIFITNEQGIITYANPSSELIFGFSTDELLGNNVSMLMPEHIAQYHHQYLIDFHLTGQTGTIGRRREIQCCKKDGQVFPAELSLGASKENNHYVFIGIITDISERKAVESKHRKSEQLREILTNSAEGIMLLFTPQGICRLANKAAIESIQRSETDIIGHHISDFLNSDTAQERLRCIKLATECRESFNTQDVRDQRTFENTYTPIIDDNDQVSEVAIHALDITERLKYEASLKSAKKMAEDASKSKTLFITKVSHELKNPLHSILGFAHIIEDSIQSNGGSPQVDELKEATQTIIQSGSHILNLINDLLDISSAELDALPIKLSSLDTQSLIGSTVEMMKPIARASDIHLQIQVNSEFPIIIADQQRTKQVLTNLISNAIKYNRPGGVVSVHSYLSKHEQLSIAVKDNGIGIPPEDQKAIFNIFSRASNGLQSHGNGLGLHLCKQLVEQMRGSIHFQSSENNGSQFWFKLPLASLARQKLTSTQSASPSQLIEEHEPKARQAIESNSTLRLLVVEDNPSNLKLMKKITARMADYQYYQAETYSAGKHLLEQLSPDVLILDLNLPDGDGLALLDVATSVPRIVVLSAFIEHDQLRLSKDKVDLILNKPVNIRQLTDQLSRWHHEIRSEKQTKHSATQ
ncbi:PAS domain S-box protein [Litoribrevibacter euphylliae]|uniref:histidine kinase n=1 Tax=Litoribrevibacter euphylliae TaxID=1834034 RepID=A0ABV7HIM9_9GAMM